MKLCLMIVLFAMVGCGNKGKSKLHLIREELLPQFVNQKAYSDADRSLDKTILNRDYPIEIALYNDGRFYYDLPRLGDGHGTWRNSNGVLKLKAKRTLFDMHIEVKSNDEEGKTLAIQFSDRFGPKTLKMENINIEEQSPK